MKLILKLGEEICNIISLLIDAKEVAGLVYNFLSLPKNMEISEVVINRK